MTRSVRKLLDDQELAGVLAAVLKSTCTLTGQVEPFIWLVGRMVEEAARDRRH